MKFDITAVYFALLKFLNNIDEIPEGPTRNKDLFLKLCRHFCLKKKDIESFRTNLYFAWTKNYLDLAKKVKKGLENKNQDIQQFKNSPSEYTEKKMFLYQVHNFE